MRIPTFVTYFAVIIWGLGWTLRFRYCKSGLMTTDIILLTIGIICMAVVAFSVFMRDRAERRRRVR